MRFLAFFESRHTRFIKPISQGFFSHKKTPSIELSDSIEGVSLTVPFTEEFVPKIFAFLLLHSY